jgi:hypothetical protein
VYYIAKMILWDDEKNKILVRERGVSFEMASTEIAEGRCLDVIPHPSRLNQKIFVIRLNDYVYAVPFVRDDEGNFFLKTIYPSRELNKLYGENND